MIGLFSYHAKVHTVGNSVSPVFCTPPLMSPNVPRACMATISLGLPSRLNISTCNRRKHKGTTCLQQKPLHRPSMGLSARHSCKPARKGAAEHAPALASAKNLCTGKTDLSNISLRCARRASAPCGHLLNNAGSLQAVLIQSQHNQTTSGTACSGSVLAGRLAPTQAAQALPGTHLLLKAVCLVVGSATQVFPRPICTSRGSLEATENFRSQLHLWTHGSSHKEPAPEVAKKSRPAHFRANTFLPHPDVCPLSEEMTHTRSSMPVVLTHKVWLQGFQNFIKIPTSYLSKG